MVTERRHVIPAQAGLLTEPAASGADRLRQFQTRVDVAPARTRDPKAIEQLAAGAPEQIRDGARMPEGHQRLVDSVRQRRAMADLMQLVARHSRSR